MFLARLSEQEISQIRAKADIVDVIGRYVPLTRKGKSYKCVCPFHDDHDPSMSIAADKQIYKCFVCGAGGNDSKDFCINKTKKLSLFPGCLGPS